MYNDQTPDGAEHDSNGHTKGVVSFDSSGGFWLVHSVPEFLMPSSDGYSFPESGEEFGQSFLCLSLSASTINQIAALMQYNRPYIYDQSLGASLAKDYPAVLSLVNGSYIKDPVANLSLISTTGGTKFVAFAKTAEWNNDLYEFLVQPYFKMGMQWQTWQDGTGDLPSFCTPQYKYDSVDIQDLAIGSASWKDTDDHSKWGCSMKSQGDVVCIGDINRQSSQYARGGGTVCASSSSYYDTFSAIATSIASCGK